MFNFNALISRIKYIPRWSLMRQSVNEDVAQHTAEVAQLVHTLCLLANEKFGKNIDCEKVVVCAVYHDVSEILTGDMPTPVKYNNSQLKTAYKEMEQRANDTLMKTCDPAIADSISAYVHGTNLSEYERKLLKAADKLSALIKCIEELNSGNKEFKSAYETTLASIKSMKLDEADYFIDNMLGAYELCLDNLAKII